MGRVPLHWKIFAVFLLVIALCLAAVGEFALLSLKNFYLDSQKESLTSLTRLARQQGEAAFAPNADPAAANALARRLAAAAGARLTLILPDGRVIGDSDTNPAEMENHADRPEIQKALHGETGTASRVSQTVGTEMLYVALPVERDGQMVGVLRISRPLIEIEAKMAQIRGKVWQSCLLGAIIAALISLYFSRRMSRPIRTLHQAADRYARGEYGNRMFMSGPPEFVGLAKAMNRMAKEMDRRLREITRQRNEREAILASMREGVLAVDRDERIIMLNPSAEALLGITAMESVGRLVQEVLRHAELQRFLSQALAGRQSLPEDYVLQWTVGRLLQVESAPLFDEEGGDAGLLVVFNDVTRLNRLENLRREFVANVSHELRTPITSIKGFIETLRDGAIHEPENAERFLEIIARQADRLNAIIEDLLALSRLERQAEGDGIERRDCGLRSILETTIQHFAPQCQERRIRLNLECPPAVAVRANPLLEHAIGNLLDNAIKYSPDGKAVLIGVLQEDNRILVQVRDEGSGIPAQHLARIFERFYRVDTARSREIGGTGLGLSIVKHIINAHGGQVSVKSEVGRGSTFTIELPAACMHEAVKIAG